MSEEIKKDEEVVAVDPRDLEDKPEDGTLEPVPEEVKPEAPVPEPEPEPEPEPVPEPAPQTEAEKNIVIMRQLRELVIMFKNKEYTQEDLEKHLVNIGQKNFIIKTELDDHIKGYSDYEKVDKLIPLIMQEIVKVAPVMGFDDSKKQEQKEKAVDKATIAIFEHTKEVSIDYSKASSAIKDVASFIGQVLTEAENRVVNSNVRGMTLLVKDTFGEDTTVGDLSKYTEDYYAKEAKKVKEKLEAKVVDKPYVAESK